MSVGSIIQVLIQSLALGMLYVLMVLGLDIILRVSRVGNFAHGQFFMVGAYVFYFAYVVLKLPFLVGLLLAVLILFLMGCISYMAIFDRVQQQFKRDTAMSHRVFMSAMASLGLMMVISQGALLGFGSTPKDMPSVFPQILVVGDVRIIVERLVIVVVSLIVLYGLYLLMSKTKLGKSMRAVSMDAEVGSLYGVDARRTYLLGFALGCALAGVAGVLVAPVWGVTTDMGDQMVFSSMMVWMVGGIGSYKGAVLSGMVVGEVLGVGNYFIGGYADLVLFVVIIAILVIKPGGFFGEAHD